MSTVPKFRVGDRVRVIDPQDPSFDKVGTVIDRELECHLAYEVDLPNVTTYYAAADLILAPGRHE